MTSSLYGAIFVILTFNFLHRPPQPSTGPFVVTEIHLGINRKCKLCPSAGMVALADSL